MREVISGSKPFKGAVAVNKLLIIAGVCGLLIAIGTVAIGRRDPLRSGARRAWKETAIAELDSRFADPTWVNRELAELRKRGASDAGGSDGWLSDRLIVMRNGDWLAYASICQKEDARVRDLFLGRGSDGRWYYSTFHFCKQMIVLKMEEQPVNLVEFAQAYHLRAFDGHSDDCLQKTWPPASR